MLASDLGGAVERLEELVADGRIRPIVGATFELDDGRDALEELAGRRATGKVVLTM